MHEQPRISPGSLLVRDPQIYNEEAGIGKRIRGWSTRIDADVHYTLIIKLRGLIVS